MSLTALAPGPRGILIDYFATALGVHGFVDIANLELSGAALIDAQCGIDIIDIQYDFTLSKKRSIRFNFLRCRYYDSRTV
jgi:hypothetical protein